MDNVTCMSPCATQTHVWRLGNKCTGLVLSSVFTGNHQVGGVSHGAILQAPILNSLLLNACFG